MKKLRVAVLHNFYTNFGGEDLVFQAETELLRSYGHEVLTYTVSNDALSRLSGWRMARQAIWNSDTYRDLRQWFAEHRPDVAHFHNIFYILSPSSYQAACDCGAPVVQTLHNYRLICPGGQLLRNGKPCELCVGKVFPIWGTVYGCYRGNRQATFVRTLAVFNQRRARLWQNAIQVFIALTEFSRQKFIEGGLPAHKLVVKPNFLHPDPGAGEHTGSFALFVGRLSQEKGIDVMLRAWEQAPSQIPLRIIGDGPLAEQVQHAAARHPHIHWLGKQPREQIIKQMQAARLLIFPSVCYETMGLSLVEAMATGLPAVASAHGSRVSMLVHGETGFLFEPGNADALREQVMRVWEQPALLERVGRAARAEYLSRYTAERNYEMLMEIYQRAIEERKEATACVS